MKKHSCGSILYTIYNNNIYIVLGLEKGEWFPFKGTREKGETNEQTAIREIYEETCKIVKIDSVELKCKYSTKRKHYHIGITFISFDKINKFHIERKSIMDDPYLKHRLVYLEKTEIQFFKLDNIFNNNFHEITYIPIRYYYSHLKNIQNKIHNQINIMNMPNNLSIYQFSPNTNYRKSAYVSSDGNVDRIPTIIV